MESQNIEGLERLIHEMLVKMVDDADTGRLRGEYRLRVFDTPPMCVQDDLPGSVAPPSGPGGATGGGAMDLRMDPHERGAGYGVLTVPNVESVIPANNAGAKCGLNCSGRGRNSSETSQPGMWKVVCSFRPHGNHAAPETKCTPYKFYLEGRDGVYVIINMYAKRKKKKKASAPVPVHDTVAAGGAAGGNVEDPEQKAVAASNDDFTAFCAGSSLTSNISPKASTPVSAGSSTTPGSPASASDPGSEDSASPSDEVAGIDETLVCSTPTWI